MRDSQPVIAGSNIKLITAARRRRRILRRRARRNIFQLDGSVGDRHLAGIAQDHVQSGAVLRGYLKRKSKCGEKYDSSLQTTYQQLGNVHRLPPSRLARELKVALRIRSW